MLPRFLGVSSRDAKEVVAAILPCPEPPRRDVVTVVRTVAPRPVESAFALAPPAGAAPLAEPALALRLGPVAPAAGAAPLVEPPCAPAAQHAQVLLAPEAAVTRPARERRDQVEPLTADLRRLSVTVSARFLQKLATARDGLSHAQPSATTEQVLEAALDLLLERQSRRQALVKRPRAAKSKPVQAAGSSRSLATPAAAPIPAPPADPRTIPAAVEREVRLRDENRCQYPLDAGGVCGATFQVQLDHVRPLALGGATTVANLRCACASHNRRAADLELGSAVMAAARRRARRG